MPPRESAPLEMPGTLACGPDLPGLDGVAAFSLHGMPVSGLPVLIAAPHGGRAYSNHLLDRLRDPDQTMLRLEDRHTDRLALDVARASGAWVLVAHAPRAMIDLNRSPDDIDWDMIAGKADGDVGKLRIAGGAPTGRRARSGLGLIPRRLPGVGELWRSRHSVEELESRIARIHEPYHAALGNALSVLKARWGAALLVDLHSMPPLPARGGHLAAEFVIGDRFGAACDGRVAASAFAWLGQAGRLTAHNRPYAGDYVLSRHAAPKAGLHGVQLEIDRRSYLDGQLQEPGAGYEALVDLLAELIGRLGAVAAGLGADASVADLAGEWPEAAE